MYKISHGKVLRNTRYVDEIAMVDVRDYTIAAVMYFTTYFLAFDTNVSPVQHSSICNWVCKNIGSAIDLF